MILHERLRSERRELINFKQRDRHAIAVKKDKVRLREQVDQRSQNKCARPSWVDKVQTSRFVRPNKD